MDQEAVRPAASANSATTRTFVMLATILASSMAFMDGSVVTVALPAIRSGLGAGFGEAQWASNAYTLTLAAFTLLGGAAGDAFGLRRVFMIGIALFGFASAACGLAWSPEALIFARAIQGVGGALMVPGSLALISAHYPPESRGRAIGTWAAASSIAPAIGPVIGGALVDIGSWRWIFLINLPIAIIAWWLCRSRVPADRARAAVAMDWIGGAFAVVGLGLLAFGLTRLGEPAPDGTATPYALIALLGAAVLAGFVVWEMRARNPMMPLGLFADRTFAGVNILTLLLYFALSGALFFLPTALIQAHGYPATLAGSVFLPFVIVMGLLSRFGGGLADKIGVRPSLTFGPILTGIAFCLLALAVADGGFWRAIVPTMLLMGAGMGITVAPLSTAVMNSAPEERHGAASGINNAVARVASLLAVASLGIAVGIGFHVVLGDNAGEAGRLVRTAGFGGMLGMITDGTDQAAVTALWSKATIAGFAATSLICGALAILAGIVGWIFIRTPAKG
ncbi:DHA2 family efflux MFS transporter permease subunit [Kaistia dalseonensis]|uniref:EmrB/QacA subfamily drug resistance transporter n=1 Tax=Kaistia dalseonensis TaxID=410840 RepID=A0ABU0H5Y6_9HYPH|nr:DHA2 family efflux MFS transporter permease subunit [Kaistia dalseonensis]MCX5495118.1 DHA2 family efflux MFS transporter permease subunit [Kaistia dalseonensis]MDQ0437700.1 EmrB/QacA subfamily drug resistance transporter [Kaistia dalseonensis]